MVVWGVHICTVVEGWREKQKQRSSRLFGDKLYSIPCGASCFGSVHLEEKDEFILLLWVYSQLSAVQLCLMKFLVMCQTMVVQVNSRKH